MRILFDTYKAIVRAAVNYTPFVNANVILSDATTKQDLLDRIDAQRADFILPLDYSDVMASGGIVGTLFSLDTVNREIDVAAGALSVPEDRVIFNSLPLVGGFLSPFEAQTWLLGSGSTILSSAIQVHYRFGSTDDWHNLLQTDRLVVSGNVQFSLFLPTLLGTPKIVDRVFILGRQI